MKRTKLTGTGLALTLTLAACSGGGNSTPNTPAISTPTPVASATPLATASPTPIATPTPMKTAAPTPTPTPSSTPGIPASITQTVRLGLAQSVTFASITSGASGIVSFPATSSGAGTASVTLSAAQPAGIPVPQLVHHAATALDRSRNDIGAAVTPLAYIVVAPSVALTFDATPAFAFDFANGPHAGYVYVASFDPTQPSLGWTIVGGPEQFNGTHVTLPSQRADAPPLATSSGVPAIFAIVENTSVLPTPSPAPGTITEYFIKGFASYLYPITTGSDGNLWFYQQDGQSSEGLDNITPSGVVTKHAFTVPPYRDPQGTALGADGNVWFTETSNSSVAKVTSIGALTEYRLPIKGTAPWGMTEGPDGNIWFTEPDYPIPGPLGGNGAIGKITPNGKVTDYPLPIPPGTAVDSFAPVPLYIAAGADGNLWFTMTESGGIGKITTSGAITTYITPTANSVPYGITRGSDGNVWFTEPGVQGVGRITPSGAITEFAVPQSGSLQDITTGSDGNLYATDPGTSSIFRISTSGVSHQFTTPTQPSGAAGITSGPDGNIWFAEPGVSQIGKLIVR